MSKLVTVAQAEQLRKMANEKRVDREVFQTKLLDNGMMSHVLDAIKEGTSITFGVPLVPPLGGRIHPLKVKFQLDQEWQAAINVAGPGTSDNYNVRKVGNLYPPTGVGIIEEELILLNYPKGGGSWDKALAWAEQFRLRRTDPRRVFAVGKDHPKFNYELGVNPTYVVATEECTFGGPRQACSVWWLGSECYAGLSWVEDYGRASDWFAFRK